MQFSEEVNRKMTQDDLYEQFQSTLGSSFKAGSWHLAIFEGSPIEGLYSWCPDCIVALPHIKKFEEYNNKENRVKLVKFKVGLREEWESTERKSPFKQNFPHLQDLPTAVLFYGKLDVFRIIAPREQDLEYALKRTKVYEEQIASKDWSVPKRFLT